ncbi:MAG: hypothetical protein F6K65_36505 [Moorea sp. SIO3C2]|nr:hypothetical protein [Moorena sp. SIO3C2]
MEECVRGSCLVGKWSWVRDEIAFRLVFAHPTLPPFTPYRMLKYRGTAITLL